MNDFLLKKKARVMSFILTFFSITGIVILLTHILIGSSFEATFTQAIGLTGTILISLDYFLRRKYTQSSFFLAVFGIAFLTYRYYLYQSYIAPTLLWFTVISPSMAWMSNKKLSAITYIITYLAVAVVVGIFYFNLELVPTSPDVIYILGSYFISAYLTFIVLETQDLYTRSIEKEVPRSREESHQSQLITLGEFAGNVAHEMNNPFQVIKGNAALISKKLKDHPDPEIQRVKKYATNIDKTVDRTKRLIDSLLRLSRFPNDAIELGSFSFQEVWNLTYPLLETKLRNSNAEISISNIDRIIYGHKDLLAQVILNLLNNSLFEIKDHKNPWIKIKVNAEEIDVIDSGEGIPKNISAKIFTPFFSTKEEKGTGLGLSLCMNIMNQMQGNLYLVEGKENTTIRITLPKKTN